MPLCIKSQFNKVAYTPKQGIALLDNLFHPKPHFQAQPKEQSKMK